MSENNDGIVTSVLLEEHELLGAQMGEWRGAQRPLSYPTTESLSERLHDGCLLADLTGTTMLFAGGEPAASFGNAAFGGKTLSVGAAAFEAVLVGDGSVASIPLTVRTGDHEYLAIDASPRAEMLGAWLSFLSTVEQKGYRPYDGLKTDDVSHKLVPLLLWGRSATPVLADYVDGVNELPQSGEVRSLLLDKRIAALTICVEVAQEPAYLMLVSPALARTLWRSMLSFESVAPLGVGDFGSLCHDGLPWSRHLATEGRLELEGKKLLAHDLLRDGRDYVGARALFS